MHDVTDDIEEKSETFAASLLVLSAMVILVMAAVATAIAWVVF
ncbi:MAG: hypothetical protein AAF720_11935 [Pseudomonadota bacterium]